MSLFSQVMFADELTVGMPYVPEKPNHLEIHSLYDYVIFDDLLRPLVKFDSNGEIDADLVLKWEVKDDFKKYIFTLKENQVFSDNTQIDSETVIDSLKTLVGNPKIVHGDGKKIKKISKLGVLRFEIELFDSDPFFLTELSSPEYRIIKMASNQNYNVTSGPYTIDRISKNNELILKINSNYSFGKTVKFKKVIFKKYEMDKPITKNSLEKFDIIWPKSTITNNEIENIKEFGFKIYQMNLGFSFWFSLNPNSLDFATRRSISNKINDFWNASSFFEKNNLNRAKQLFLPYGPGRMTEEEISKILNFKKSTDVKIVRPLKVLLPKGVHTEIVKSFDSLDFKTTISYYENFNDYSKKTQLESYDILLVNNDLSSIDLRSSLIVTFNSSRPLVFIEKNDKDYSNLLKDITKEQSSPARYKKIKTLGEKVLQDALVVPLYYKMGILFAKPNVDLSDWNKAGSETYAWKIK